MKWAAKWALATYKQSWKISDNIADADQVPKYLYYWAWPKQASVSDVGGRVGGGGGSRAHDVLARPPEVQYQPKISEGALGRIEVGPSPFESASTTLRTMKFWFLGEVLH